MVLQDFIRGHCRLPKKDLDHCSAHMYGVAIAPAPAQLLITMAAVPLAAQLVRVLPAGHAAPPGCVNANPSSQPVAPTSPCNNREEKQEERPGYSALDREALVEILATRQRVSDQHGVLVGIIVPTRRTGYSE